MDERAASHLSRRRSARKVRELGGTWVRLHRLGVSAALGGVLLSGCGSQCLAETVFTFEGVKERLTSHYDPQRLKVDGNCLAVLGPAGDENVRVCEWSSRAEVDAAIAAGAKELHGPFLTARGGGDDVDRVISVIGQPERTC